VPSLDGPSTLWDRTLCNVWAQQGEEPGEDGAGRLVLERQTLCPCPGQKPDTWLYLTAEEAGRHLVAPRGNGKEFRTNNPNFVIKSLSSGLAQWLTPIIPATQEMKIRRIPAGGQPGQHSWTWLYICNSSYTKGIDRTIVAHGQAQTKSRPHLKTNLKQKGLETWLKWESTCLASVRP
jgi:hypothetical protein